jgi:hypothetical protein
LEDQALATLRGQLVEIISGAIFVFVGLAACAIAAIRRSGVRLFLWLGIWSAMYGTGLLTRAPAVVAALPRWLQMSLPYANAANTYLVVVVAFFAFLELTVGRLRLVIRIILVAGIGVAVAGIGWVVFGGSESKFMQYNQLVTVCGLLVLLRGTRNVWEADGPDTRDLRFQSHDFSGPVFRRHRPALMVPPLARYLQVSRRESLQFEPQAFNQPSRCFIIGLNVRFESVQAELSKGPGDHGAKSSRHIAATIVRRKGIIAQVA